MKNVLACRILSLSLLALGMVGLPAQIAVAEPKQKTASTSDDLIESITTSVIWDEKDTGVCWFHPRACAVPIPQGTAVLMTLQTISGSDFFGPLHWSICRDPTGQNRRARPSRSGFWSKPAPIAGMEWREIAETTVEGACDVVPEYHAKTDTVLAIGHNVYYRNGKIFRPQPPRWPVYLVRNARGEWSAPRQLEWNDPRGANIYSCGCAQRLTLPNGDVLIPMTYGASDKKPRSVSTFLCSFDGQALQIKQMGNELKGREGRGFLEPSLARLGDRYYMTIRAGDGHGYVTVSDDGLNWSSPQPWAWNDGEAITMSTTQQRWLPHSNALYLVYTRKDAANVNVFRWRAPLYVARVDPSTLRLIRSTERIVFPLQGDGVKQGKLVPRMGNFHTVAVSPEESWVTVGEARPAENYHNGRTSFARVRWSQPNRSFSSN